MSSGCSPLTRQRILKLRYEDGYTQAETARMLGLHTSTVQMVAPGRVGKVSNRMLREAFIASGLTASEVARRMCWWSRCKPQKSRNSIQPDASRLNRTLGITPENRQRVYRKTVDYELACNIADAIGVAPWEILEEDAA